MELHGLIFEVANVRGDSGAMKLEEGAKDGWYVSRSSLLSAQSKGYKRRS